MKKFRTGLFLSVALSLGLTALALVLLKHYAPASDPEEEPLEEETE